MLNYKIKESNTKNYTIVVEDEEVSRLVLLIKEDHYIIEEIYTESDYRNLGLASILITKVVKEYRDKCIFLEVAAVKDCNLTQLKLIEFYEKFGFVEMGVSEAGLVEMVKYPTVPNDQMIDYLLKLKEKNKHE